LDQAIDLSRRLSFRWEAIERLLVQSTTHEHHWLDDLRRTGCGRRHLRILLATIGMSLQVCDAVSREVKAGTDTQLVTRFDVDNSARIRSPTQTSLAEGTTRHAAIGP
jgi:hypothetical protein